MPDQPQSRPVESYPLLSHLRWIAALVVVLSHIQQTLLRKAGVPLPAYPEGLVTKPIFRAEGFGHAAVVVFFVLSGFLVGGKLLELAASRQIHTAWPHFLRDRVARIFIVLLPALLLTGLVLAGLLLFAGTAPFVSQGGWSFTLPSSLTADLHPARWLGAPLLLNEFRVPTLETDGPLWSLSYEWFYYMAGLAVVLCWRRVFSRDAVLLVLYALALTLLALLFQPDILVAGLSWVAGLAARHIANRHLLRGPASKIAGPVLVLAVLACDKLHPLPDLALGLALGCMIAHSAWPGWRLGARPGGWAASWSYSLYVTHFPVLLAVMGILYRAGALPRPGWHRMAGLALAGAVLLLILAAGWGFSLLTEAHTRWLKKRLPGA